MKNKLPFIAKLGIAQIITVIITIIVALVAIGIFGK